MDFLPRWRRARHLSVGKQSSTISISGFTPYVNILLIIFDIINGQSYLNYIILKIIITFLMNFALIIFDVINGQSYCNYIQLLLNDKFLIVRFIFLL